MRASFTARHSRRTVRASSGDKTARLWDAATAKEVAVLRGHDDSVYSAAFSPDGKRVVTASGDKTARVWDAATVKEVAVLRGHERIVYSAAFSPDGTRVVTASGDKTARLWDAPRKTANCA
jgi:WD40 repeat protein